MTETKTLSEVRKNFPSILNEVTLDRKIVVIKRRNAVSNAAIISEDDLKSLMETAYLMSSPANAKRLLDSFERTDRKDYVTKSIDDVIGELGVEGI